MPYGAPLEPPPLRRERQYAIVPQFLIRHRRRREFVYLSAALLGVGAVIIALPVGWWTGLLLGGSAVTYGGLVGQWAWQSAASALQVGAMIGLPTSFDDDDEQPHD